MGGAFPHPVLLCMIHSAVPDSEDRKGADAAVRLKGSVCPCHCWGVTNRALVISSRLWTINSMYCGHCLRKKHHKEGRQNSAKVSLFIIDFKQSVLANNFRCCGWSHFSAQLQVQEPQHAQGTLRKWHWVNKAFPSQPQCGSRAVLALLGRPALVPGCSEGSGLGRAQRDLCSVPCSLRGCCHPGQCKWKQIKNTLDLLQTDLCVRQQCHKAEMTKPCAGESGGRNKCQCTIHNSENLLLITAVVHYKNQITDLKYKIYHSSMARLSYVKAPLQAASLECTNSTHSCSQCTHRGAQPLGELLFNRSEPGNNCPRTSAGYFFHCVQKLLLTVPFHHL